MVYAAAAAFLIQALVNAIVFFLFQSFCKKSNLFHINHNLVARLCTQKYTLSYRSLLQFKIGNGQQVK